MQGVKGRIQIDTGATDTFLAEHWFLKIPECERPPLYLVKEPVSAFGNNKQEVLGFCLLEVTLSRKSVRVPVYVVDLEPWDTGVLGLSCIGPLNVKIDTYAGTLEMDGEVIECFDNPDKTFSMKPYFTRLKVDKDTIVPAGSETVVMSRKVKLPSEGQVGFNKGRPHAASVRRLTLDKPNTGDYVAMVSPTRSTKAFEDGIGVCHEIVNPCNNKIPLRVLNVNECDHLIKAGTVLAILRVEQGQVEPFDKGQCNFGSDQGIATESVDMESSVVGDSVNSSESVIPAHLLELYRKSSQHLDVEQGQKLAELLQRSADVFSCNDRDIGRSGIIKHEVVVQGNPVRQRPYRTPIWKQDEVDRQVKDLLDRGLIEESTSPWASPVVLVKKKDGTQRLCVDYRKLNALTVKDSFPLPRIDDALESLHGAVWFSTLDLQSGYWQIELDQKSKPYTAFCTKTGLYQWRVLPFGLTNAPSTFERIMERCFSGLSWKILLLYLDDVIVFAQTFKDALARLELVFNRLRQAGLKLKPNKCVLFASSVEFLGHRVSAGGVATDTEKVEVIKQWPVPKSVTEVRGFLGLTSYYRRFVRNFAEIARPLYDLTKKNVVFDWSENCQSAFDSLKHALTVAPVLAFPSAEDSFILDTDASGTGIGAVLSQVQQGEERPISYAGRVLSSAERRYCVTRRELLAVVNYVKYYRHYLLGRKFTLRTDHASLIWLMNFKNPEGQLARWIELLQQFNFTTVHRPGLRHTNADALSRVPAYKCKQCGQMHASVDVPECLQNKPDVLTGSCSVLNPLAREFTPVGNNVCDVATSEDFVGVRGAVGFSCDNVGSNVKTVTSESKGETGNICDGESQHNVGVLVSEPVWSNRELREMQNKVAGMGLLISAVESNKEKPRWEDVSSFSPEVKACWASYDCLRVVNGVLYRLFETADGLRVRWQMFLPRECREQVLKELHTAKSGGHLGMEKLLSKVRMRYFWYGMASDVRSFVRMCDVCACRQPINRQRRAPLQTYVVGYTMERVAIDILGPFPESFRGNKKVLVFADYFTKWVEYIPIKDEKAATVAEALVSVVFSHYGMPGEIHSDRGRDFISSVFREVCSLLGSSKTYTTPRHPQSDGMVERHMKSIVASLKTYLEPKANQRDWDTYLPYVGMAYRSAVHSSTAESPNMMMLGREIAMPVDLMFENNVEHQGNQSDYAAGLRSKIQDAHVRAREQLRLSSRTQKKHYDRYLDKHGFQAGDFVWLKNEKRRKGFSPKLQLNYEGPYMVVTRISDVVYRIQQSPRSKYKIVHYEKLKKYEGKPLVPWLDRIKLPSLDERVQEGMPSFDPPTHIHQRVPPAEQLPIGKANIDSLCKTPDCAMDGKVTTPLDQTDCEPDETSTEGEGNEQLLEPVDNTSTKIDITEDRTYVKVESTAPEEECVSRRYPKRNRKHAEYFGFGQTKLVAVDFQMEL